MMKASLHTNKAEKSWISPFFFGDRVETPWRNAGTPALKAALPTGTSVPHQASQGSRSCSHSPFETPSV